MTTPNSVSPEKTNSEKKATATKGSKPPARIVINVAWCKGCGICVDYCKPQAITMEGPVVTIVSEELCTRCRMCEAVCPDFAIEIDPLEPLGEIARHSKEKR